MISHVAILNQLRKDRMAYSREGKTPDMLMFLRGLTHAIVVIEQYVAEYSVQMYQGPMRTTALYQTITSALSLLERNQIGSAKRRLRRVVGAGLRRLEVA